MLRPDDTEDLMTTVTIVVHPEESHRSFRFVWTNRPSDKDIARTMSAIAHFLNSTPDGNMTISWTSKRVPIDAGEAD